MGETGVVHEKIEGIELICMLEKNEKIEYILWTVV